MDKKPKTRIIPFTDADRLRWVSEGQKVIVPYGNEGGGLICTVEKAMGNLAIIFNKKYGYRRLVDVTELFPGEVRREVVYGDDRND